MRHRFYQLDVFTDRPLGGNPLAVFPEASGMEDNLMQALAREMNLSETTFVTPSDSATRRVRFFTPTSEIPLAGHPTVGTWWLLAELGMIELPEEGDVRVTQETGRGDLPVDLFLHEGRLRRVVMTQASPEFGQFATGIPELAAALGGETGMIDDHSAAPQVVSTALPQLMIPFANREDLEALPSGGTGADLVNELRKLGTDCAMCYRLSDDGTTAHCRMFAPGLGVPEDPATGSAAGALGAYLVWHGLIRPHGGLAVVEVEQGVEIGRPSSIRVEVAVGNGGEITEVHVGGEAVKVIEGEVSL